MQNIRFVSKELAATTMGYEILGQLRHCCLCGPRGETGVGAEGSGAPSLASAKGHLEDDAGEGGGWPGAMAQDPSYTQHPQATAGHIGKTINVKKHQFYVVGTWYLLYDFIIL